MVMRMPHRPSGAYPLVHRSVVCRPAATHYTLFLAPPSQNLKPFPSKRVSSVAGRLRGSIQNAPSVREHDPEVHHKTVWRLQRTEPKPKKKTRQPFPFCLIKDAETATTHNFAKEPHQPKWHTAATTGTKTFQNLVSG